MDGLQHIVFWHWWVLAAVLVVLELRYPVFLFLWLGFAAAAIGFLQLVFPNIPPGVLLALLGLLTLIALLAWRGYRKSYPRRRRTDPGNRSRA
jgi:membrane protein implicated in regulation of membrane protease activity